MISVGLVDFDCAYAAGWLVWLVVFAIWLVVLAAHLIPALVLVVLTCGLFCLMFGFVLGLFPGGWFCGIVWFCGC